MCWFEKHIGDVEPRLNQCGGRGGGCLAPIGGYIAVKESGLVKVREKEGRRTSRVLKANRFSIDLRTYTRSSTLQLTTSIWDTVHDGSNIMDARNGQFEG